MTEHYRMYTGDEVKTVSVWVVKGDKEYPIYANTRGRCEWYTHNLGECENTTGDELSDELITWLAEYHRRITGQGEMTPNREMPDVEWYEIEFLNAIGEPMITDEAFELMEWAYEVEQ